jgi:two-component system sensor histidine kinase AlgZ
MKDSRILSTYQELHPMGGTLPLSDMPALRYPRELVFDTCKVGVVLRTVLFVQAVVVVGAMFGAHGLWDWMVQMAVLTGAALPATLAWLLAAWVRRPRCMAVAS